MTKNKKTILLTGGGTLGSVSPLLAVYDRLQEEYDFYFVGTINGPEKELVEPLDMKFYEIMSGKLRRYLAWQTLIDPFRLLVGFWQSFFLLLFRRPSLVVTAGSFVSVPVVAAAWLLRVPVLVHQLDFEPGLANRLMSFFSVKVAATLEKSAKDFASKGVWTGTAVRYELEKIDRNFDSAAAKKSLGCDPDRPLILVIGGGTGAQSLNKKVLDNLYNLTQLAQVMHLTGRNKTLAVEGYNNYWQLEFLQPPKIFVAMAAADLVISRAGMGVLSELAAMRKPVLLAPMPDSHQEQNAAYLAEQEAAAVLGKSASSQDMVRQVKDLLADRDKLSQLGGNLCQALMARKNGLIKEIKAVLHQAEK